MASKVGANKAEIAGAFNSYDLQEIKLRGCLVCAHGVEHNPTKQGTSTVVDLFERQHRLRADCTNVRAISPLEPPSPNSS
jgi:hypothetical protein